MLPMSSSFQGHTAAASHRANDIPITPPMSRFSPPRGSNYNWAPSAFLTAPSASNGGSSITLFGVKFNGLSQATAYGDDLQNATNYPIVRITNVASGHVFYCRTHDHSSMAVAYKGLVNTRLNIPANMETGQSYPGSGGQWYSVGDVLPLQFDREVETG